MGAITDAVSQDAIHQPVVDLNEECLMIRIQELGHEHVLTTEALFGVCRARWSDDDEFGACMAYLAAMFALCVRYARGRRAHGGVITSASDGVWHEEVVEETPHRAALCGLC